MKIQILILIFTILFGGLSAQTNWKIKKDKDGIKVFTRKPNNSDFFEFRATAIISANLSEILEILQDAANYSSWIEQITYSKIVSSSYNNFVVYYQIDLPIGMKDRDIVFNNEIIQMNNDKIKVVLSSIYSQYPEDADFVRIKEGYGYWMLMPNTDNSTTVIYQCYTDPMGNFPAWLVNLFIVDGPYKTLKNLQNMF